MTYATITATREILEAADEFRQDETSINFGSFYKKLAKLGKVSKRQ